MDPIELARDWQLALANALSLPTKTVKNVVIEDSGLEFWGFNGAIKILNKKIDFCTIDNELQKLKSYSWKYETSSAPWYLAKVLDTEVLERFTSVFPAFVCELTDEEPETTKYTDVSVKVKKVETETQFKAWEDYVAKKFEFSSDGKEIHSIFFWNAVKEGNISCYSAVGEDGKVKATGAISLYNGAAYISNGTFKEEVYGASIDKKLIEVAKKLHACALVAVCEPEKKPYMEGQGYKHVTDYQYYKTVGGDMVKGGSL